MAIWERAGRWLRNPIPTAVQGPGRVHPLQRFGCRQHPLPESTWFQLVDPPVNLGLDETFVWLLDLGVHGANERIGVEELMTVG